MIASLKRAFIPISLVTMVGGAFYLIAVYPSQNQQSYADLRKQALHAQRSKTMVKIIFNYIFIYL